MFFAKNMTKRQCWHFFCSKICGPPTGESYFINIEFSIMREAPVIGINRQQEADGSVRLIVSFGSCPLRCKGCDSPQCFERRRWRLYTTQAIIELVEPDREGLEKENGALVFTAGEPCMRAKFIADIRNLIGDKIKIELHSALNVPSERVQLLLPVVDRWVVDVKDMNPRIYRTYTGKDNLHVIENLRLMEQSGMKDRVWLKVPALEGLNTEEDRARSMEQLRVLGFEQFV